MLRYIFPLVLLVLWSSASAAQTPCERLTHRGAEFVVCTIDTRRYDLRLFSRGDDGIPYGGFRRLTASAHGADLVFAMNAGMFDTDLLPIGLHVEGGRELKRVNTANGPGNFHLKPNGVFYVHGVTVGVVETSRYLRRRLRPDYATQSGPMLVIEGRIHPRISASGTSRKIRNGVGVTNANTAVFAISEAPVTFFQFAQLFRDRLRSRNALFLDGSVSSLHVPSMNRSDWLRPIGPIVGARLRE